MMENSTNEALMDIEPSSTEVKSLDEIAFEVEWSGFFHTKDAESRPVLHAIVKYLRKVQDRGASLPEIKVIFIKVICISCANVQNRIKFLKVFLEQAMS